MPAPSYKTRINQPGHAHYMTFSCYRRQPFLHKDRPRQWLCDASARAATLHDFALWAWVIMHNSVRRGPVTQPEDWYWSSAQDCLKWRDAPVLPLDRKGLPRLLH
ncbi:MAG: hypothetical protein WCI73_11545 [Phycisphaerae bacterium]